MRPEGRKGEGTEPGDERPRPHLQEGPPVGCVEGVQCLLQPPLCWEGRSRWAGTQARAGAVPQPLNVLSQAPKKRSCGTAGDESGRAWRLRPTCRLLLPGAEAPQRETRSRGPSRSAGPAAMPASPPRWACLCPSCAQAGLQIYSLSQELGFLPDASPAADQASVGAAEASRDARVVWRGLPRRRRGPCLLCSGWCPAGPLTFLLCASVPSPGASVPVPLSSIFLSPPLSAPPHPQPL